MLGTNCTTVSRIPSAHNWKEWQLCYPCARKLHPEYYAGKKEHGTGGTYLKAESYSDFTIVLSNTTPNN